MWYEKTSWDDLSNTMYNTNYTDQYRDADEHNFELSKISIETKTIQEDLNLGNPDFYKILQYHGAEGVNLNTYYDSVEDMFKDFSLWDNYLEDYTITDSNYIKGR